MARGYSFRPRLWPWLLAAAACAAGIALGNWQSRRAEEKRTLGERFEEALRAPPLELSWPLKEQDVLGRKVAARGTFDAERTVLLDNKILNGRVGYEVVTPLKLSSAQVHVLVDRGWVPAGASRAQLPAIDAPKGEVRIEGLAQRRLAHALEGGPPSGGQVRQNLEIEGYAKETGLTLLPLVLEELSGPPDGLVREPPHADTRVDMHRAYALQWYCLAALAVVLAAATSFKRVQVD
ncbi:MAG TPA: SURF1 family protein [Burkholderiales bacterium]